MRLILLLSLNLIFFTNLLGQSEPDVTTKNTFKVFGYDFKTINDSTYSMSRHGEIKIQEFKKRYFSNCIYKSDTLSVINMKLSWGNQWRIDAPCHPFYLKKLSFRTWLLSHVSYSIECNMDSSKRTIHLGPDGTFYWDWQLTSKTSHLSAGTYELKNDSILILQSDAIRTTDFVKEYIKKYPQRNGLPKLLKQRHYLFIEDKMYFINEYK